MIQSPPCEIAKWRKPYMPIYKLHTDSEPEDWRPWMTHLVAQKHCIWCNEPNCIDAKGDKVQIYKDTVIGNYDAVWIDWSDIPTLVQKIAKGLAIIFK